MIINILFQNRKRKVFAILSQSQTNMADPDQTASSVLPVCFSDKHFVNFSPDNQHFIAEQKEKSF